MTPPFLPGEVALLHAINGAHSPFWDAAMFLISNVGAWTFPAIALLIFLFYRRPKSEAVLLLLMVGLCVALGDVLSSTLAKPFFERLRPTHTPWLQESLHYVYGYHGKLYGFFSGHSANYTAVATFLCLTFRDRRFTAVLSLLVAWVVYSRMYIGAHFFSDCLGVSSYALPWAMVSIVCTSTYEGEPLPRATVPRRRSITRGCLRWSVRSGSLSPSR